MTIQPNSSDFRFTDAEILQEAAQHCRRLGKIKTDAGNMAWKMVDAIRDVRNNNGGQQRREALVRLVALITFHGSESSTRYRGAEILREAEQHSRRLDALAVDADRAWWRQVDATRDVRNARDAVARHEALIRLAVLHASYDEAPLGH